MNPAAAGCRSSDQEAVIVRILITGATGFVGRHLVTRLLDAAHHVVVLSRDGKRAADQLGVEAYSWAAVHEEVPPAALEGTDAIIHLMGESIGGGRWTAALKQRAQTSRIVSADKLIAACPQSVKVFVSASAVGYYPGHLAATRDEIYDESYRQPAVSDFMQSLCRDWEAAVAAAENKGVRAVSVRIGIALGDGGLLDKLVPLFRLGLGGPVGDGQQWLPWIHVRDLVEIIVAALMDERYRGPINAVAPVPVRYAAFAKALGRAVHRPAVLPLPAPLLKLAMGEAAALALNSYRVVPSRLAELGYRFRFADIGAALSDAVRLKRGAR
jgi:uncharacterized protein (TIGR01777 family)